MKQLFIDWFKKEGFVNIFTFFFGGFLFFFGLIIGMGSESELLNGAFIHNVFLFFLFGFLMTVFVGIICSRIQRKRSREYVKGNNNDNNQ